MKFFKRHCLRQIHRVVGNNQTVTHTHTHTREHETFELLDLPQPGERNFLLDVYTRDWYIHTDVAVSEKILIG